MRLGLGLHITGLRSNVVVPPSTSTFSASNSAIVYGQGWNGYGSALGGRNGNYAQAEGAGFEVDVFGTSFSVNMYLGTNGTLYVDGTPNTLIATGGWQTYTVSLGSSGWHRLRFVAAGAGYTSIIDWTSNGISVTGAPPTLRKPTAATGVNLSGNYYLPDNAAVQLDGTTEVAAFGIGNELKSVATNQGGRYRLKLVPDGSGLPMSIAQRVYPWGSNAKYLVTVDGVANTSLDCVSGVGYPWMTIASGIAAGADREVGVWFNGVAAQPALNFAFIINNGTLGTIPTACKRFAINGDSISTGQYGVTPAECWPLKLCLLKDTPTGRAYRSWAIQGRKVTDMTNGEMDAMGTFANVSGDAIILAFGVNDQNTVAAATFQSNLTTALNYMLTKTTRKIYVVQYFDCLNGSSSQATNAVTNRAAYKTAYQNAIAACTTPSQVTFIDTDGVIDPATDLQDGIHPNAVGYTKIAAHLAAAIT